MAEVPDRYGPWTTIRGRLARRAKDDTLLKVLKFLRPKLDERGRVGGGLWRVDATVVPGLAVGRGGPAGGKDGDSRVRRYLRRRGVKVAIPTRKDRRPNPRFDKAVRRRRTVVERRVGRPKGNRRVGTRLEKLAVRFPGRVHLAMIRRYRRLLDS